MTKNEYLISRCQGDQEFDREVDLAVKELARGYPARHHGQRPPSFVITQWRYDCALRIAPKYLKKYEAEAAARRAAEKAEEEAEKARILALPENKIFWELRRKERKLWKPLYRAYQRGEKVSAAELDALVECADALLEAAKARADAELETAWWDAEWPANYSEPYEFHYAKEHQRSARELRDLMKA